MTTRTLFLSDVLGRFHDMMTALGIKRDLAGDPAAPPPGPAYQILMEQIAPFADATDEDDQECLMASLSLVMTCQTSGGNRAQTSVDLMMAAEKIASALAKMNVDYDDMTTEWSQARNFVGSGNITKCAISITVDY